MPLYEYVCTACQERFEELIRSAGEERALRCPKCGQPDVARQPSVFAARSAAEPSLPLGGGCARCGDPNGPCGFDGG